MTYIVILKYTLKSVGGMPPIGKECHSNDLTLFPRGRSVSYDLTLFPRGRSVTVMILPCFIEGGVSQS